jgi:type II secretion system protein H
MRRAGFSLIEILIVIAIIGLVMAIVLLSFNSLKSSQTLDKDAELVVQVLRQARSQTLASQNASSYGVHFASSTITLFAGTSYSAGDTSNQNFNLNASDTVIGLSLAGSSTNVVFSRLSGEAIQDGTITLSSLATNRTRIITVYKTGLIEFR